MKDLDDSSTKGFAIRKTDDRCVIEFNDILNGYNSFDKVGNVYKDMIKELEPEKKAQSDENDRLICLKWPNWRGGNYNWQLFKKDDSLLIMEFYGDWKGYAHESNMPPKIGEHGYRHGRITVMPPNEKIQESIVRVLEKYPASSKKDKA